MKNSIYDPGPLGFLEKETCDRCGQPLVVRTMSWFTEETICLACSDQEGALKEKLRKNGVVGTMEGCGFVPDEKGNPK